MDYEDVIAWITDDAAEMASLLREAEPDQPVSSCPGWNAADLSHHMAVGFSAWYPYNISTPADQWTPDGLMARIGQVGDDHRTNVALFESGVDEFITCCVESDLDVPTWAFGGVEPGRWWIRRAGTELTVHLTDAAGIHGRRSSTTPERHAEAIDEVTTEVFPRLAAVKATMSAMTGADPSAPTPPESSVTLVADDVDRDWTLASLDGSASATRGRSGVVAATGQGSSADVLAWLHGRPLTAPLTIDGAPAVLDGWNLFQRAQL
jgi:hypothetical protein